MTAKSAHAHAAPHRRGAGAARAAADRQPPHRRAVRRVRVLPECAEGEDRLERRIRSSCRWSRAASPSIEAKLGSILTKIDNMPLDAIGSRRQERARDAQPDAEGCGHAGQARRRAVGARGHEDARGAAPRDRRRRPRAHAIRDATLFGKDSPAPQDLRDTLQEVTRAARARARPRRLSRTSPRNADPGQARGETVMRRIASVAALCAVVGARRGLRAAPPSHFYTLEPRRRRRRAAAAKPPALGGRRTGVDSRRSSTCRRSSSARARTRCRSTSSTAGRRRCRTTSRAWSPRISSRSSARRACRCSSSR